MAPQEEYHRKAELYSKLAEICTDPDLADRLRAVAAEYFALGGKARRADQLSSNSNKSNATAD